MVTCHVALACNGQCIVDDFTPCHWEARRAMEKGRVTQVPSTGLCLSGVLPPPLVLLAGDKALSAWTFGGKSHTIAWLSRLPLFYCSLQLSLLWSTAGRPHSRRPGFPLPCSVWPFLLSVLASLPGLLPSWGARPKTLPCSLWPWCTPGASCSL